MIELTNISKVFKIPHERRYGLKQTVVDFLLRKKFDYEQFHALKDVNLKINKGDFVGITGPNGSGKSTLLKIIAGILQPTTGTVKVNGKISSILELGTGFNGELTARENVYLYGSVLGLTRKQLDEKFDKIIGFAELHKFVDTKLKNFSSGMYARLAFAIAIQIDAPILLVDEVLAVGDVKFQQKCFEVFERFKRDGKTIVLVSHSQGLIDMFCDRVVCLQNGSTK